MKKHACFAGILVLVFGLMFVGCDNLNGKPEKWTAVTDFSQLDGTWKGSTRFSISMKELMQESTGMTDAEWEALYQEMFGNDMSITMTMNITETFDSAAKTISLTGTITMTYSGSKVNGVWAEIKNMLTANFEGVEGVTINDANHSITITIPPETMYLNDDDISAALAAGIFINQDGNKIKVSDEMSEELEGILGNDIPEMILIKQ